MPYQVQQLIEGKGIPVCVTKDDAVTQALSIMIEYDYSQLPVIIKEGDFDTPEGMITYEGILRGIRNFKANIENLRVRDVMVSAPIYSVEDDLFDILDRLKDTNAVLIEAVYGPDLVGIVTSYDTAEYFRNHTEDLMRVEDIELMIKDFIKIAYTNEDDALNVSNLQNSISQVAEYKKNTGHGEKILSFEDLTLGDYISLLFYRETWNFIEPIFGVQRGFVKELLDGVRVIRNSLAHFRGDITAEQRDRLKFATEWLNRQQEEYQALKEKQKIAKLIEEFGKDNSVEKEEKQIITDVSKSIISTDFSVTESVRGGGRYAPLADWLQSQPGRNDKVQLSFNQIEEIIEADLPASARNHRAWWANDSIGHSHSQLWLDAGWRTTYINFTEGKITFSRMREREKAYIAFFSKLLDEFRKQADFDVKEISPDGASWLVIQNIPSSGPAMGYFTFTFSRSRRFRVELYLDLMDQEKTKAVFDRLYQQKERFIFEYGEIEWERLDNRRASRLAIYHDGYILDKKKHPELIKWAAMAMVKFRDALNDPAEEAIREVVGK